jgi:hypothetical protein
VRFGQAGNVKDRARLQAVLLATCGDMGWRDIARLVDCARSSVQTWVATEQAGRLKVAKVNNTDEQGALAQQFGIQGRPTMQVFVGGKPVVQIVGAAGKKTILEKVESLTVAA